MLIQKGSENHAPRKSDEDIEALFQYRDLQMMIFVNAFTNAKIPVSACEHSDAVTHLPAYVRL
jgi:hypothetical protein